MASLHELLAECKISIPQTSGQEKTAAAAKPSSDEIDRVLENIGLKEGSQEKTASETEIKDGGKDMSLENIYKQVFGEQETTQVSENNTEKTAGETEAQTEEQSASTAFGGLVGEYFNVMADPYFEKVAGDLETEAGKGTVPTASLPKGSAGDPHMPVNHPASGGAELKVMTNNQSPYSLKEQALQKAILRRMRAVPVGEIKE
jgi:hypothetical protein